MLIIDYPSFFAVLCLFVSWIVTVLHRLSFAFTLNSVTKSFSRVIDQDHLPVLVVGGGGYIGCHVVKELLRQGFLVREW